MPCAAAHATTAGSAARSLELGESSASRRSACGSLRSTRASGPNSGTALAVTNSTGYRCTVTSGMPHFSRARRAPKLIIGASMRSGMPSAAMIPATASTYAAVERPAHAYETSAPVRHRQRSGSASSAASASSPTLRNARPALRAVSAYRPAVTIVTRWPRARRMRPSATNG